MIYSKIKNMIAKKMKPTKSLDQFDEEKFHGKMPKKASIYHRGKYDPSNEPGHGMRKEQGLTNYINYMLKAEKEGKYQFDKRRPVS